MSNRRKEGEREINDRRVIDRITSAKLRENFKQIRSWVKTLVGLALISAIYQVSFGFYTGGNKMGAGILTGALLVFIATYLYRYQAQITLFLENDSVKNLENTLEKAQGMWTVIAFFSLLVLIIGALSQI
jgi:hypothetical protein